VLANAPPSPPAKEECPPGIARSTCREIAEAAADEDSSGSRTYGIDECPPGLSEAQCREFGELVKAAR
jgi:hypothetical protein